MSILDRESFINGMLASMTSGNCSYTDGSKLGERNTFDGFSAKLINNGKSIDETVKQPYRVLGVRPSPMWITWKLDARYLRVSIRQSREENNLMSLSGCFNSNIYCVLLSAYQFTPIQIETTAPSSSRLVDRILLILLTDHRLYQISHLLPEDKVYGKETL